MNLAIYRLAWNRRWISPWSCPPPGVPPRGWADVLPIAGWLCLRREAEYHGRYFWIRPLLLEVGLGVAVLWFYQHAAAGLLYPAEFSVPAREILNHQIVGHLALFALLVACTFIDFDEKTIPDELTVPGTVLALIYVSLIPTSLLPNVVFQVGKPPELTPLWFAPTQLIWPMLDAGRLSALLLALAAWGAWTFALLHKTCTLRRGFSKGIAFLLVSSYRRGSWLWMLPAFGIGALFITIAWWRGGEYWLATLSSLAGIVFGGGMIWTVRVVGTWALRQEAMGFGDVTLMAMIGAILGWQPTIVIFFLAPAAAVLVASGQYLFTRKNELAFGPYLALATIAVVYGWAVIWFDFVQHYFALGWLLPAVTVTCLVMMGGLLWLLRTARETLWPLED